LPLIINILSSAVCPKLIYNLSQYSRNILTSHNCHSPSHTSFAHSIYWSSKWDNSVSKNKSRNNADLCCDKKCSVSVPQSIHSNSLFLSMLCSNANTHFSFVRLNHRCNQSTKQWIIYYALPRQRKFCTFNAANDNGMIE